MAYSAFNPFDSPVAAHSTNQKDLYHSWFRIADEGETGHCPCVLAACASVLV